MNGEKMNIRKSPKGQAMPAEVIPIRAEAFEPIDHTKDKFDRMSFDY